MSHKLAQLKRRLFLYSVPLFVLLTGLLLAHFHISASSLAASTPDDKMSGGEGYRAVGPLHLRVLSLNQAY